MKKLTLNKLAEIICQGDFEVLKDHAENEFFDCKRQPYSLGNDFGKRKLAQDISSFANLEGGYIFIGPHTGKESTHPFDIVTKISYLEYKQIDGKRYENIVGKWIYPPIDNLSFCWKESKDVKDKGVFVITIPAQDISAKPFLITKHIEEKKNTEVLFGYSERKTDSNKPKDIESVHLLMRDGLSYVNNLQGIETQISEMKTMLASTKIKENLKKSEMKEKEINQKVYEILNVNNMNAKRACALIAYPQSSNMLKTIFSKAKGSILNKLEHPGNLRDAGWSLETLDRAKIIEGKLIQVCNGERKTVRLYRDGILAFSADHDFWAWPDKEGIKLNCLGIVEGVYSFVEFYQQVRNDFNFPEDNILFKFGLFNLQKNDKATYLSPGSLRSISYQYNENQQKPATANEHISSPLPFNFKEIDVGNVAYQIIKEIYLWFGIIDDEGAIPYIKKINNIDTVDVEQIINAK